MKSIPLALVIVFSHVCVALGAPINWVDAPSSSNDDSKEAESHSEFNVTASFEVATISDSKWPFKNHKLIGHLGGLADDVVPWGTDDVGQTDAIDADVCCFFKTNSAGTFGGTLDKVSVSSLSGGTASIVDYSATSVELAPAYEADCDLNSNVDGFDFLIRLR